VEDKVEIFDACASFGDMVEIFGDIVEIFDAAHL